MALSKLLTKAAGCIGKHIYKSIKNQIEKSATAVYILDSIGLSKPENNFESLYIHSYVKFCIGCEPTEFIDIFKEEYFIHWFEKYLTVQDKFALIETIKNTESYKKAAVSITIEQITEKIDEFENIYNENLKNINFVDSQIFLQNREMLLEKHMNSFKYQIITKLNQEYESFHEKFIKDNKYIDLNARTMKPKKNLEHLKPDAKDEEKYDITNFDPVYKYINNWLNNDSSNFLIIMGEYGTGKTTLCDYIKYNLTCKLLDKECDLKVKDNKERIPMIFPLSLFAEKNIYKFILSELSDDITNINSTDLKNRLNNDELLVIFDGFDEMAIQCSDESKKRNFRRIKSIIEESKASKFILTTREEYFRNDDELRKVFDVYNNNILHLKLFDDEQINKFLIANGINSEDAVKLRRKLSSVMERPVLLELVCKYFPNIKEDIASDSFSVSDLYRFAIEKEIHRVIDKNDYLEKNTSGRKSLLEEIAVELFIDENKLHIDVSDIRDKMQENSFYKGKSPGQIENDLIEFLSFSFLIKERDDLYKFSHKSFRDYLVAVSFTKEIESGNITNFGKAQISHEIAKFISEQIQDIDKLKQTATEGKIGRPEEYFWQAGNAVRILQLLGDEYFNGLDLRKCNLKNIVVSGEILNTNFEGADFSNSTFSESAFSNSTCSGFSYKYDDMISTLTNLSSLDLFSTKLRQLPDSVGSLVNLQILRLDDNQLTELPDSIGNLINLQRVWLHDNQLAKLTESIGSLVNLQELSLDNNQLTELPDSIGNLENLKFLTMDDNQLTELPDSIIELKKLEVLYIRSNPIPKSHIDWLKENMPDTRILSDYD